MEHADDLAVEFEQPWAEVLEGLPGAGPVGGDAGLGQVGAGVEAIHTGAFARRDQPPADEGDEQQADTRDGEPDRREVKHPEAARAGALAKAGDDQVGRGADEGRHAAEDRPERQRHQHAGGRQAAAVRHLDGDRHEQGQRADVVHERGKQRAKAAEGGDRCDRPCGFGNQVVGQEIDRTGRLEAARKDEDAGDRDDRRVAKAVKRRRRRHQPGEDAGEQRAHGDHVVPPFPP